MLSALWGSAFVFIKIAAPAIGAVGLVFARLVLASLLLGVLFIRKEHFKMIKENTNSGGNDRCCHVRPFHELYL